jgi:hypothetical protein
VSVTHDEPLPPCGACGSATSARTYLPEHDLVICDNRALCREVLILETLLKDTGTDYE